MIKLLKERGVALRKVRDIEYIRKIDKKIDEEKEKLLNPDNYPVSAFVTFKTAAGFRTAIKNLGSKKNCLNKWTNNDGMEIFGEQTIVKQAPDPSNIIWENYSVSERSVRIKRFGLMILLLI